MAMAAAAAAVRTGASSSSPLAYRMSRECSCTRSARDCPRVDRWAGFPSRVGSTTNFRTLRKELDGEAIFIDGGGATAMKTKKNARTKFPRPLDEESAIAVEDRLSSSSSSSSCARVQAAAYQGKKGFRSDKRDGADFSVDSDGWLQGYDGKSYRTSQTPSDHKSGYVALLGKANVGKSTLINQLIGQKICIVTHKPQTTRHRILGIVSGKDYQVILFDTPGIILKQRHKLDEVMMRNLRYAMANADAILMVVDASEPLEPVQAMVEKGQDRALERKPTLLVMNKIDLLKPADANLRYKWYQGNGGIEDVVPISAKTGSGISLLKDWVLDKMPYGPVYYPKDIVSEHSQRFFVSEILREKIFLLYHQEIPYCTQVQVAAYRERDPGKKDFIEMEIYVEKESQKGIVLGKGGMALKELAVAARKDIEQFVGKPVFLELRVKVKEGWREDEESITKFGLDGKMMGRAAF